MSQGNTCTRLSMCLRDDVAGFAYSISEHYVADWLGHRGDVWKTIWKAAECSQSKPE
jgi:hypothetical protein